MTTWLDLSQHGTVSLTWELVAVDECDGTNTVLYTAAATAPPGDAMVSDSRTITIPGSHPLMLYTVSVSPARVASKGLLVTPGTTSC